MMEDNLSFEIEAKIKKILTAELAVDPATLANSNSSTPLLGRGIGLDSIETLALVAGIEEGFDIQIEDNDLTVDLFKDIGTLAAYVLRKTSERQEHSLFQP
jgi:acyl carrier protein